IHDFTAAYNENAAPFVWRKRDVRGAQLRDTIVNLCN
ncbi:MAG: IS630 family transposase, partial [Zoogloeaceae bacterium]|nr:IS630 family transposase [Zoogloeaceae bacterium]